MQKPPPPRVEPSDPAPLPPVPVPVPVPEPSVRADEAKERPAETLTSAVADDEGAPERFGHEPGYDATD